MIQASKERDRERCLPPFSLFFRKRLETRSHPFLLFCFQVMQRWPLPYSLVFIKGRWPPRFCLYSLEDGQMTTPFLALGKGSRDMNSGRRQEERWMWPPPFLLFFLKEMGGVITFLHGLSGQKQRDQLKKQKRWMVTSVLTILP